MIWQIFWCARISKRVSRAIFWIIFQKFKKKNRQIVAGYKCDGCGQEPIKGGRFTCQECDSDHQNQPNSGIDFCLECAPKGLVLEDKPLHTSAHNLRPVRKKLTELPTATADLDYLFQNNYLDSNFVNKSWWQIVPDD